MLNSAQKESARPAKPGGAQDNDLHLDYIAYSRGYGKHDNIPVQHSVPDFDGFIDAIARDVATGSNQQWIAGPAGVAPDDDVHRHKHVVGKPHRCASCVQPRRFIGLDIDDGLTPESFIDLVTHCQRYHGLVYTTASHTPDKPRCRVILAIDDAAPRNDIIAATKAVQARIQRDVPVVFDPSADKPEQPLYLPLQASDTYRLDGEALCLAELLADAPTESPNAPVQINGVETASNTALVSAIIMGEDLHDSTTRFAFRLVDDGMQPAKVVETVRGLMGAMPDKGDLKRWRDRYADIPRLVSDAGRKLASAESPSLSPDIESKRFELLTVSELMALPDMTWRVEGVIPDNSVGLIIGQYQAGKSFVVIDLLARLACGADWFGHEINPGRVVYCALEGNAGIKKRVQAWQQQHADDMPSTFDTAFRTLLTPFQIIQPADIQGLADAIDETGGADVIAVDTLAQAAPGIDENSAQDMGGVVQGLQSLQRKTGGIVIGVHHLGKDTTRGARGNSNLPAAMDFALAITGDRHISTDFDKGGKTKDGEPINHYFDLDQVALSNGDTSAVVVEAAKVRHEVTRLSPTEKIAIRSYNATCQQSGQWGDDSTFIGVHLDDWRAVFYEMSTADSTDSKRKAFSRVRTQLQDKRLLKVEHDMYTMEDEDTFRMMTINNGRDAA